MSREVMPSSSAAVGQRSVDAVHHRREVDAAVGVGLRIEEDLRVAHALVRRAPQVRRREVGEVLLGHEHGAARVVQVEERLEIVEHVRRAHRLDVRVRQRDAVARRELEHQLRLERALDVQVQLGLGQALQPFRRRETGHSNLRLVCVLRAPGSGRLRE